jgi:cytidylate kinase
MKYDVALDGPSGSGKTSIGRAVAGELGLPFVDSGLLYRAVTALYVEAFPSDLVCDIARLVPLLEGGMQYDIVTGVVSYCGGEIRMGLHDPGVDRLVSPVSAVPEVRRTVNRELVRIAGAQDVVMAGRDIGTTVLPQAFLKVFITADPVVRAGRRVAQLAADGVGASIEDVLANIRLRDTIDSSRQDSPLRCTEEYLLVDNSVDGSRAVVDTILAEYRRRRSHAV